jgi:hypothetical protein
MYFKGCSSSNHRYFHSKLHTRKKAVLIFAKGEDGTIKMTLEGEEILYVHQED